MPQADINTTPTPAPAARKGRRKARLWTRILKFLLLTAMAVVLFVYGMLVTVVSVLTPQRLTPLVERLATAQLVNARVEIDTVRLTLRQTLPYLTVDVKNLRVISGAIDSLAPAASRNVPDWADTLVSVRRFRGGINLGMLPLNRLSFSDLVIDDPQVSYVVVNDSVTNFNIFRPEPEPKPEKPFDWSALPGITIRRFSITRPRPMRYLDVATGTYIAANFRNVRIDGNGKPVYKIAFDGNVHSPQLMQYFVLPKVAFALDGNIVWNQRKPRQVEISDMNIFVDPVRGRLSTNIDIADGLVLNKLDVSIEPVDITRVLNLIPQQLRQDYGIPEGIVTNARVGITARLEKPFDVGLTSLPHAVVNIKLPDSRFSWQKVKFDNIAADIDLIVRGDDLDKALVRFNSLNMRGPATDLRLEGTLARVGTNPLFDGSVHGTCRLEKLPPVIMRYIPGYIRGTLRADARIKGSPSMLTLTSYHRLYAEGQMSVSNFYFVSQDTTGMAYARNATFTFGTHGKRSATNGEGKTVRVDSLLTARVTADSAAVLHSDLSMKITDFSFGIGAVNRGLPRRRGGNRPHVVPMGGHLHVGTFSLILLTDSAGVRIRDVDGSAVISAHVKDFHTPEFRFSLDINRFSAGSQDVRLMFRGAHTDFTAFPQPQSRAAKQVRHIADSVARRHPDIPPDSIYRLALAIHNSRPHSRYPRVHPELTADSTELIDWGTSNLLKRLLTQWNLSGNLIARRAGLFTPVFPLRNRLTNVNMRFNNDSIVMEDVRYKCGHSDVTMSGVVSNMRRALTSASDRASLKADFEVASDTIDVNQLADAVFTGSAYMSRKKSGYHSGKLNLGSLEDDEEKLEREIDRHVAGATDSMAPLLIPQNLNAEIRVKARNVMYSDLMLHNMQGRLLTYRGALNLHDLSASSQIGSMNLSALYDGRSASDLKFGFGLKVNDFNISRFLRLVPAIDSIMPLLRDFGGIISADIAATSDISPTMDLDLSTLEAAVKLQGDSLVLLDPDTFKSLSKWLMFKDKKRNVIDHMAVQMLVRNNVMQMYPFVFNIDRYKLGVQGSNDFAMNFKYHISVLKSPLPFKFGINIEGNPDKYKIRLGGAKLKENAPIDVAIVDTTRVNLIKSLESIFRRGVERARFSKLRMSPVTNAASIDLSQDTLTHADSLMFIREGLIPAPDTIPADVKNAKGKKKTKSKDKKSGKDNGSKDKNNDSAMLRRETPAENRKAHTNVV